MSIKYQQFSFACDQVKGLIENDWTADEAIEYVAEVVARSGDWDQDDLRIELGCMNYCDVASYN